MPTFWLGERLKMCEKIARPRLSSMFAGKIQNSSTLEN